VVVNNNKNLDRVDIVNLKGQQLLEIHHPPGVDAVEDYTLSQGADLSKWPIVQKVISGVVDELGDKYVTLAQVDGNNLFITIGPVKQDGKVVGAVLVSSYVRDLLGTLAHATFSDVSLYDINGRLLSTTLNTDTQTSPELILNELEVRKLLTEANESSVRRRVLVDKREYFLIFGIFQARGEPLGIYSVALQTTPINSYGETARNTIALIFAAALVLVFGIGYFMANTITGRLQHLMENALAVANGDFSRRTRISSEDEIGSLANSLDHMTESLAGYTNALRKRIDELTALYEGSTAVTVKSGLNLEHVLQAVTTSVKEVIRGTDQVIVYLPDKSSRLLTPRAATSIEINKLPSLAFEETGNLRALLSIGKPQSLPLAQINSFSLNGSFKLSGSVEVFAAPLLSQQEIIGLLILTPDKTYPHNELLDDDNERLLGTMANQAAIAIKNAQLFEATQQAYEELRKLDDLKTQFINIAAHELRTPLGAMMGYASYAEKRAPEKLKKSMRFMVASTVRMRTMVDAMLTIQRLDAGTAFLRLIPVDIHDVIGKVVNDFEAMAELEGHSLTVDLPDELPTVEADPEKISLILSNLISNAIKFTPEGGSIVINAKDYLRGVLVSVSDTGAGIAPEDQERVFERFYQVRAGHIAGHGGIGLGLTIVKQLVELHQGQIWLESELGQGTTFYFTIPQETPITSSLPQSRTASSFFQKAKALLLETEVG
jgi:signal transduction histidine kinase/HAMP domain-containing protein